MKKVKLLASNWLIMVSAIIVLLIGAATLISNGQDMFSDLLTDIRTFANGGPGSYQTRVKSLMQKCEDNYNKYLYGKPFSVEVSGLFDRIVNKKVVVNSQQRYTVYKMNNGQLTWNYIGYGIKNYAEKYMEFAEQMTKADIPLIFVQAPYKINKYNNELPYGIKDETNPLADRFLAVVSPRYDTIDLRSVIHDAHIDHASMFYNTDHHWTAEAGLWASGVITQMLMERYALDLDTSYLSRENYSFQTMNKYMLGSQGKRTGRFFAGLDDFVLIEPAYETKYHVSIPAKGWEREGKCSETLLFLEYMGKNLYEDDPGRVYTGDNYSLMVIRNLLSRNNTRLLLIKDSFSKSLIPSFASTCQELHVIDLRTFDGSVAEYAKRNGVDCVVVMYNPSVVVNDSFFAFD